MTAALARIRACAVVVLSICPAGLQAAEPWTMDSGWPERFNRIGAVETVAIGGIAAAAGVLGGLGKPPVAPRGEEAILFDDSARSGLRGGSETRRPRGGAAGRNGHLRLAGSAVGG